MSTIPAVPTSYTTGSQYMSEVDQKWDNELSTLDTLPNAFAQLIYIMFVMMPTKEQEVGGKMEYQDYLMDQVSDQLIPRLDDIKSDFNEIVKSNPNDYKQYDDQGNDAVDRANEILQLIYTNPNLSSNAQLVNNVTSAISGLFTCDFYTGSTDTWYKITMQTVAMTVNINGESQTIDVPQLEGEYSTDDGTSWGSTCAGNIIVLYWDGYSYYDASGSGEHLSDYENEIQGWTGGLNELSTNFTDFSKTATSVFQFYMGEEKQLLSILDNCMQDISKGEQQAINNEITS